MSEVYEFRVSGNMGPGLRAGLADMSPEVAPSRIVLHGRLDEGSDVIDIVERLLASGVDVRCVRRRDCRRQP